MTLHASADYVARYGKPTRLEETKGHRYLSLLRPDPRNIPFMWVEETIPDDQIVFRARSVSAVQAAARAGMGIAPAVSLGAVSEQDLAPLFPAPADWVAPLWLVTHRDNHRTPKVQAIHRFILKEFGRQH